MFTKSIVLVGRSNVGKSTLFNRLTKSRDAIVGKRAGLTRDRHFGFFISNQKKHIVIDTGGWEEAQSESVESDMVKQTVQAVVEADTVFFMVDARAGLLPRDIEIASNLRRLGKIAILVVNKAEGLDSDLALSEFSALGYGDPLIISALHGDGIFELMNRISEGGESCDLPELEIKNKGKTKIAVIGKPNVGKSTLVNYLLGEERLITRDEPGTTRDSIFVDFSYRKTDYLLIDTAGVRKKSKVVDDVEKFSVIKTLHSINIADVIILTIDASSGLSEQDARLGGYVFEAGKALVVAVNKWDILSNLEKKFFKDTIQEKLKFLSFSDTVYISALTGVGVNQLLRGVQTAFKAATTHLSSARLNRVLRDAVERQSPPMSGRYRPKLKFAHQGGTSPPRIIIHGNGLQKIPNSYRRFLQNFFIENFALKGTPVKLIFRSSENPYAR